MPHVEARDLWVRQGSLGQAGLLASLDLINVSQSCSSKSLIKRNGLVDRNYSLSLHL